MTATPDSREFWRRKRVLVTGGAGFVGSAVVRALRERGVADDDIVVPRSAGSDLRVLDNAHSCVRGCQVIIHLAAPTGGIAYSRTYPASQYRDSMLINLNLLEAARTAGVEKILGVGNLLAYPAAGVTPLTEPALFDGPIAPTHLGVGLAKRDQVQLAQMYHQEFNTPMANVLAANAYGPGDRLEALHAHVIPATIAKCYRDEDLIVWGDGSPTRDFLFVDDLAEGALLATERLEPPEYVNLASGTEISIRELVETIVELTGFKRRVIFDTTKGGGDPRRAASTARTTALLGFAPRVSLREGLARTIEWYKTATGVAR